MMNCSCAKSIIITKTHELQNPPIILIFFLQLKYLLTRKDQLIKILFSKSVDICLQIKQAYDFL